MSNLFNKKIFYLKGFMKVKDKKQPDNLNWQKSQDAWAKKKKKRYTNDKWENEVILSVINLSGYAN